MNASTALLHALLERGDYFENLSRAEIIKILPILEKAHDEVLGMVAKTGGAWTRSWREDMASDLGSIYDAACEKASGQLKLDLAEYATQEAAFIENTNRTLLAGISFSTPAPSLLKAIVNLPLSVGGSTLDQLFEALAVNSREAAYEAISLGMIEGDTVDAMTRRLRGDVVKRATWSRDADGVRRYHPGIYSGGAIEDVSTRQARTIARTAVMQVGNKARDAFYDANADIIKGYQRIETLDLRTCLICGLADGQVYGKDDPRPSLPAHFDCLPGDTLVSSGSRVAAVGKRVYEGDMFVIRTAAGNEIRATPNHPILTRAGFIGSKDINLGDELVCDAGIHRVSLVNADKNEVEISIENLFRAFVDSSKVGTMEVPTTAEDFHGDGADNEVAIITTNRELLDKINPALGKEPGELGLILRRSAGFVSIPTDSRSLNRDLWSSFPSHRIMRRLGPGFALLWSRTLHAGKLLLGLVAHLYSGSFKFPNNILPSSPKAGGNTAHSDTGIIDSQHCPETRAHLGPTANLERNSCGQKTTADGIRGYASLARNLTNGFAGPVFFDKVVDIRKINFSGHVYSLQSDSEYYIANNILTHNCRGLYVPVLKSFRELGIDMDELPPSTRASMDGQVAEMETFADRLASASPDRRADMLGPSRAALYERGLPLDAMVKDGAVVPLKDIKIPKPSAKGAA